MSCSKVNITEKYHCDKSTCTCIPTGGKPCICVCKNENGDVIRCDDCKCSTNNCQCKCDDAKCTCIATNGADCVCVCRDERGNFKTCACACIKLQDVKTSACYNKTKNSGIKQCDDCKCSTDNCQCKCDNAKCTCIATNGADCVCVCRAETGNFKTCDCACTKMQDVKTCACLNKIEEKKTCGINCVCVGKSNSKIMYYKIQNYRCEKAGCVCIPTGRKSCICVRETKNSGIKQCNDCKCSTNNCQCKCDDAKCTCITTKGAVCVCVCRDEKGYLKTCDCACIKLQGAKTCGCYNKTEKKISCGINCICAGKSNSKIMDRKMQNYRCEKASCVCIPTGGKSCICVCETKNSGIEQCNDCKCSTNNCQCKCDNAKCTCITTKGAVCVCRYKTGNFKTCDCTCTKWQQEKSCCKQVQSVKTCSCCNKKDVKKTCGINYTCSRKTNSNNMIRKEQTYICEKTGCICIPTRGKPCICVCENENGDVIRCDDCKCLTDNCQCKCDDATCTCFVTKGADCICVCRDEGGNIKTCDCACTKLYLEKSCCKQVQTVKTCGCAKKSNSNIMLRRDQNYACEKTGCICMQTGGKPCICVCENKNGDVIRCNDCKCLTDNCQCKCDDARCTCIVTKGVDCTYVYRDARDNFKTCDCSCTEKNEKSLKKDRSAKILAHL